MKGISCLHTVEVRMDRLEKSIRRQRDYIESMLISPLSRMAQICARTWDDRIALDFALKSFLKRNTGHRCRLLYVIDKHGRQYSSRISESGSDDSIIGRDLSARPYLAQLNPDDQKHFVLSDVYVDKQTHKPCITALHSIRKNDEIRGYIAADFGLRELPLKRVDEVQLQEWRQIRGDPSIRGTLFQQTCSRSAMDEHLEEVLDVVESLITEQGIFHAKLHFSGIRKIGLLVTYKRPSSIQRTKVAMSAPNR